MQKGLFLGFLMVAAGQDLRRKQVDVRVYAAFGALAAAFAVFARLSDGGAYFWLDHAASASLGIGLLGLAMFTQGGLGAGDGCFFVVSGLMLTFRENLALLCCGILCCGVFCLGFYVRERFCGGKNPGERTVPFLPFVALPGLCMALPEVVRVFTG